MREFKVGDKVKILPNNGWIKECEAIVEQVRDTYLRVKPTRETYSDDSYSWGIKREYIEQLNRIYCGGE